MKLLPYHNPQNVDESKVPPGWRFRYADEIKSLAPEVSLWLPSPVNRFSYTTMRFRPATYSSMTQIVPVNPAP